MLCYTQLVTGGLWLGGNIIHKGNTYLARMRALNIIVQYLICYNDIFFLALSCATVDIDIMEDKLLLDKQINPLWHMEDISDLPHWINHIYVSK